MRKPSNRVVAAVAMVVCALGLGACAQIPMSGPVRVSTADMDTQVDIAMLPQGPSVGASPYVIVQGFLGAAVAAATSPKEFQTAREYLSEDIAQEWDPEESVRVVREAPMAELPEEKLDLDNLDSVEVVVNATTIATLDSTGSYTDVGSPRKVGFRFTVTKAGGEWRISALDNGVLVPSNLFANQYRATRLFFPAENDHATLVPDQRWFPRSSWRADAVQQVLAGPPEWLLGATQSVVPDGTQLASQSIQSRDGEEEDEAVAVRLSRQISDASAEDRSTIAAQVSATFSEGAGRTVAVDLFSENSRLSVEDADVDLPKTIVQAMALKEDQLYRVEDGRLYKFDLATDFSQLDPTALALSPSTLPIVIRDGDDRIVNVPLDNAEPTTLMEGPDLAAPSVDQFGATWTSGKTGKLRVAPEASDEITITPDWLAGRKVISVSVSPEGARVAIVSEAPSGTKVQVAGIVRDADGRPSDLASPLSVAAPVPGVREARWSGITTLALLTKGAEKTTGVWTAGVGGLASTGGQSKQVPGLTDAQQLAAAVTEQGILVITKGGNLEREETGVWQPFAEDVDLVAYPG